MTPVAQLLWVIAVILFLAGGLTYAIHPKTGLDLLKRSAMVIAVMLAGPTILTVADLTFLTRAIILTIGLVAAMAWIRRDGSR